MRRYRKVILVLIVAYGLGLVWGQVRLPFAAAKRVGPLDGLSVSDDTLKMLSFQRAYLKRSSKVVEGRSGPPYHSLSVTVKWNAGLVARVASEHSYTYLDPETSRLMGEFESVDAFYICLFGMWMPVYSIHEIT